MEQKDILAIFNEMLTKVFSKQEDKYKRKRKYSMNDYCCSEEEKDQFSNIFEDLLERRDAINFDLFLKRFDIESDKE